MSRNAGVSRTDLTAGVLWALAAGMFWGGAFVSPLVLPGYSALEITAGRFTGSGIFSVIMLMPALFSGLVRRVIRPSLWLTAFGLAMVGNFIYFAAMAAGVQRANAAIVTLIIGMLPIAIPTVARLRDGTFSWRATLIPSLMILAGLLAVHSAAHGNSATDGTFDMRYASGIALAVLALVSWLIFALANDRALVRNPDVPAAVWSSVQGVAMLPVALPLLALTIMAGATHGGDAGRAPMSTYIAVSMGLGIATSWMAIWCWNRASQLLPPALTGQLLVFETVASLVYVYFWYGTWPPLLVVTGAVMLLSGVLLGIARMRRT